jgi:hypothetical protein
VIQNTAKMHGDVPGDRRGGRDYGIHIHWHPPVLGLVALRAPRLRYEGIGRGRHCCTNAVAGICEAPHRRNHETVVHRAEVNTRERVCLKDRGEHRRETGAESGGQRSHRRAGGDDG